jgi:hypothetical protein
MSRSRVYCTWINMRKRCLDPQNVSYHLYGGRGITVCNRWQGSFSAFWADMGEPPTKRHQIDRIDNDGPYSPANCRWVTPAENVQNRRNVKLSEARVKAVRLLSSELTTREIAALLNIGKTQVQRVIRRKSWENIP